MQSLSSTLSSRRAQRSLLLGSALLLAAGIVAVLVVFVGNTGTSVEAPLSTEPVAVPKTEKTVPLPRAARLVAGRFVLTAVRRKELAEAWKLTGPGLRGSLSYEEWLTGNIPVVPFLAEISVAPIKVEISRKDYALLQIVLIPAKGSKEKAKIFTLELGRIGTGKSRRWVVNSWAPRERPAIPANPSAS